MARTWSSPRGVRRERSASSLAGAARPPRGWWVLPLAVLLAATAPAGAQTAGALVAAGTLAPHFSCPGTNVVLGAVEVHGVVAQGLWRMQVDSQRVCTGVAASSPTPVAKWEPISSVHAGPWNPTAGGCLPAAVPSLQSSHLCLGPVLPGTGSTVARLCTSPWANCLWTAMLKTVRA